MIRSLTPPRLFGSPGDRFHVKPSNLWAGIAARAGFPLTEDQLGQLGRYRDWLRSEAIPAGAVGPAEGKRLDERHIADSLLFSWPFVASPMDLADLGSGVGLPGIPLAILWPNTRVLLIDRSGKRVDLAERAVRVLGLGNVTAEQNDVSEMSGRYEAIVSRAAIPADQLTDLVREHLLPGGLGVVGGSWTGRPEEADWEIVEIPAEMLDRTVWLLIMRSQ